MKPILVALAILAALTSNAQLDSLRPVKGDFGTSVDLSGLINSITLSTPKNYNDSNTMFFRYYIKDGLALRMGLNVNVANQLYSGVDTTSSKKTEIDSTYNRFDFYLAPGIEKHFKAGKRLDPYLAGNLIIGQIGSSRTQVVQKETDLSGNSSTVVRTDTDIQLPGGYVFGAEFKMGFNLFIFKNFSLGAEYGMGLYHFGYGGDQTTVTIVDLGNGSPSTSREGSSAFRGGTEFKVTPQVGISLSYFFGSND